jgi:hypothetical protein
MQTVGHRQVSLQGDYDANWFAETRRARGISQEVCHLKILRVFS